MIVADFSDVVARLTITDRTMADPDWRRLVS
jgi:hypothetical protein